MDFKVSQKSQMYQPQGSVDVLVNGIFDLYLVEHTDEDDQKWIDDVVTLVDEEEERDRVMFAILRQRGQDPIAPGEGIQWVEAMMTEIPVPLLMSQITNAAAQENSYVNIDFETVMINGQSQLTIAINGIDPSPIMQGYPNVI